MDTYFVCSNLTHSGTEYKRGDTVELSPEAAVSLLDAGVIQTDKIEVPAPVASEEDANSNAAIDLAVVGGAATKTGEPALDAKDVGQTPAPKKGAKGSKQPQAATETVPPAPAPVASEGETASAADNL